jgi:hypothetical protein
LRQLKGTKRKKILGVGFWLSGSSRMLDALHKYISQISQQLILLLWSLSLENLYCHTTDMIFIQSYKSMSPAIQNIRER